MLAEEHYAKGETHAGEALIEEASDWCVKACAAGEFVEGEAEAFDLMEELNARLDPDFRRPGPGSRSPAAGQCTRGGLTKVIAMPNDAMEEHLKSCGSCKAEQADRAATGASASASR